jgi:hypothetical protein
VGLMPTPENWPSQGRVTFDNVSMRYRPELPLVLQNVSFDLKVSGCCCCCGETRLMKCVAKRAYGCRQIVHRGSVAAPDTHL